MRKINYIVVHCSATREGCTLTSEALEAEHRRRGFRTTGLPYRLVTDSPYFYLSLTAMIIGTQLFLAGFLGELISRNAPERNNYQIEKKI